MSLRLPRAVSFAMAVAASVVAQAPRPAAAEPAACLSPNPSQWPAPSKPYFMLLLDASDSMSTAMAQSSCTIANGYSTDYPANRIGAARCAIYNTVAAFGGQTNFGLAMLPAHQVTGTTGPATCPAGLTTLTGCTEQFLYGTNCGSGSGATRAGANILVPLRQDDYWDPPGSQSASNLAAIEQWVDNDCSNCKETVLANSTPINGALRDVYRYLSASWTNPLTNVTFATPLKDATVERPCRTVSTILMTDGAETCDTVTDAANAAAALFSGFTIGATTWKVKTYVIQFASSVPSAGNQQIATAGGTTALAATDEAGLSAALAAILAGSISPEACDNVDNNCNGCTDEGFVHYCDQPSDMFSTFPTECCRWKTAGEKTTCGANACAACGWVTAAQRTACGVGAATCCGTAAADRAACLTAYQASITTALPKGDLSLLPCTDAAAQAVPATWLCYDPGDKCDSIDNNCNGQADENQLKCGTPSHCPVAETCNGQDDDCDGVIDNGGVCGTCAVTPSAEVCDGCDNDCDGLTDNGISVSLPCGLTPNPPATPAYCAGTITCKPPQSVPKGQCAAGGGFSTCTFGAGVTSETCNGVDDDCNGIVDDGIPSVACTPAGMGGLNYGANSGCKKGTTQCVGGATVCVGWVGPSPEVCDGIDNDCDGTVDDAASGVGQPCGKNLPPCTPGTTACVGGALVCQGGVQAKPETCNGVDDDCNGVVDDGTLADAPAPGMNGCWGTAGNCCSFPTVNPTLHWCPPPGASCNDNGALTAPCDHGSLVCAAGAWACTGPVVPSAEVCDGIDNDCNGMIDDGVMNVGQTCGTSVGECKQGTLQCNGGVLSCVGGVFPTMEVCDGKDNDCDGVNDNGIPTGGPCTSPYDTTAYPGMRDKGACKPGVFQCDGMGGLVCVGGVGPQPEVCDGIDNDCDGQIDEVGAAPDGINGTADPLPPPAANIGDPCGNSGGSCVQGKYACVNGQFQCLGGQTGQPEQCDCQDNDCDGQVDNQSPGGPPICSAGKDCVKAGANNCQCAAPCDPTKEFPCPGGQICQTVDNSNTGMPAGKYCIADPCGGDCHGITVKDAGNKVVCAPVGTPPDASCVTPPVCVCKGQNGCQDPCAGVSCPMGSVCTEYGQSAGKCVVDNCFSTPCQGCGKVCNLGACVQNPCVPDPCQPGEECKPTADFTGHTCEKSCAMVTCPSGQACVLGKCADTCSPACTGTQICDTTKTPPTCVDDKCTPNPCTDGSFCNPTTGGCGNDPCEGVVCPTMQQCVGGSCVTGMGSTGSGTSASASASSASGSSSSSGGGGDGTGGATGIWGLATGGGGCSCEVGPGLSRFADARWALLALGLVIAARRRNRRAGEEVAS